MANFNISKKIFTKKRTDYTFTILFFLIFSLFILFAIKPSLSTAAELKREESDLRRIDSIYEGNIVNMLSIQSLIESHRDEIPLLTDAISDHPQVNKMIDDIKKVSDQTSFVINKASIGEVNLLDTKNKKLQSLHLTIEGSSDFDNLMKFIQALSNQRRLKTIQKMVITKGFDNPDNPASKSGQLKVVMDLEAYYL